MPQQYAWRGWKTVGGLALAAALFAASYSGNRYILGSAIVLLGVFALVWAVTRSDERLRENLRYTRGPGWWLTWLMSRVPGAGAKAVFAMLCIAIILGGIIELAAG